ncbi:MAG: hypothetical protein RIA65_11355 [Woeseia sp.]
MDQISQSLRPRRGELLTVVAVLATILFSDVVLRAVEDRLSGNIAHINEIDELAAEYKANDPESVLFMGNSLTNNGVNAEIARELLNGNGHAVTTMNKIVPDATTIWSWACITDNQFLDREVLPATVVLGFGWNQLSDQSRILPTRLGAFFCSTGDLLNIREHKTLTSAEIGEFLTARTLRTYAHRETVRNRVLSLLVPHYQQMTQENNRRLRNAEDSAGPQAFSYSVLQELITDLSNKGTQLIIMAMPVRDLPYEIDDSLARLLRDEQVPLLDYRHLDGIVEASFLDDMHLDPDGATVLTTRMANDLVKLISAADR